MNRSCRESAAALVAAHFCALLALAPATVSATHLARIVQVYGGDVSHPDAQYVVIQMCADGQNFIDGQPVIFYDADGAEVGTPIAFSGNLPIGTNQSKIFVATPSAVTLFGIASDLEVPALLLPAGGKVCFEFADSPLDCVAWGAYSVVGDTTVNTPFDAANGLPPGEAIQRDLTISGGPTVLNCADDTNDSAADFDPVAPTPRNNAGVQGVLDPEHIFLHGFDAGATTGWALTAP